MLAKHGNHLRQYYQEQSMTGRGGSTVYFKGSRMQKGSGIGSILGKIIKSPFVKKGLKYLTKTGLSTAGDVITDLMDGKSLKEASRSNISRQVEVQKKKAIQKLKKMVNPPIRGSTSKNRTRKRIKRGKPGRKRVDNFGHLRR